ncbi:MAG TPA: response regulator [Opitutaceae bacterium]|nr:response regulator [Opitutaceae bacterium]
MQVPQASEKPALLIVDDDPDQLSLFKMAAERSGEFCRVETAENASTGVDKAFTLIDNLPTYVRKIVLTDLRMPRAGGLELVKRLRPTCEVLPVYLVAMSSSEYQPDVTAAKQAGCCAFFQKPGDFSKLKSMIGSLAHLRSAAADTFFDGAGREASFA